MPSKDSLGFSPLRSFSETAAASRSIRLLAEVRHLVTNPQT